MNKLNYLEIAYQLYGQDESNKDYQYVIKIPRSS